MYLKGSKEEILQRIRLKVEANSYLHFDQYNTTYSSAKSIVENMVKDSIAAAFSELLDNIYSDLEFEQDIGLTDK